VCVREREREERRERPWGITQRCRVKMRGRVWAHRATAFWPRRRFRRRRRRRLRFLRRKREKKTVVAFPLLSAPCLLPSFFAMYAVDFVG
jgi:hypothetical protein